MADWPDAAKLAAADAINAMHTKRGWNPPARWWAEELRDAVLEAIAPYMSTATATTERK